MKMNKFSQNYTKSNKWVVCSISSDGSDYVKNYAGAIIGNKTIDIAKKLNISIKDTQSYLDKYDSYSFFKLFKDCLIKTGKTGTNVGDLIVFYRE